MKHVARAADRVHVPDDGVVLAHFKGWAVGEGAAVEGHEGGGLSGREGLGREEVLDLWVPDGVVGVGCGVGRRDVGEEVLGGGVLVGDARGLGVGGGHEGEGFVKIHVEQGKFAVGGHGCAHLAAGVDDGGADETGVEVVVHGDVGVVGPHV